MAQSTLRLALVSTNNETKFVKRATIIELNTVCVIDELVIVVASLNFRYVWERMGMTVLDSWYVRRRGGIDVGLEVEGERIGCAFWLLIVNR